MEAIAARARMERARADTRASLGAAMLLNDPSLYRPPLTFSEPRAPARKPEPVPLQELVSDLRQGDDARAAMFAERASSSRPGRTVSVLDTDFGPMLVPPQTPGPWATQQMTATAMSSYLGIASGITASMLGDRLGGGPRY